MTLAVGFDPYDETNMQAGKVCVFRWANTRQMI